MKLRNYHLVEEVIDFSKMFKPKTSNDICDFTKIINDKEKAKYHAYEEVFGEDEYTWKDIKENEMSEVWGEIYELNDDQKPQDLDVLLEVFSVNVRRVSAEFNIFFEDVVADLNNCAINRAVNGNTHNFFKKLFEIYKAGYFPCGWYGDYPNGSYIALKIDSKS
ncbi:hypothetical protein [Bacillus halotolerans]|uniref:hypothetical protein n=1 Tax=Bacillus halotolerans TaxID=260554 RepID=UPI000D02D83B|nr:hypothetical protein [Bacillus halotolerans]MBV7319021.1 hypothetical protein [Halalkalibacterium halodurans]MCP9297784.1 hypothetical protein [Bacillus halotolerans]PRS06962.1 hypothetical protein C6W26_02765 [Bacillus halotolerans]QKS06254.1 hypothetical protein HT135_19130 [Bacillus halotolerans]QNS19840.1 hypothetical protein ICJ61_19075 [Bacillus halotolerans]